MLVDIRGPTAWRCMCHAEFCSLMCLRWCLIPSVTQTAETKELSQSQLQSLPAAGTPEALLEINGKRCNFGRSTAAQQHSNPASGSVFRSIYQTIYVSNQINRQIIIIFLFLLLENGSMEVNLSRIVAIVAWKQYHIRGRAAVLSIMTGVTIFILQPRGYNRITPVMEISSTALVRYGLNIRGRINQENYNSQGWLVTMIHPLA